MKKTRFKLKTLGLLLTALCLSLSACTWDTSEKPGGNEPPPVRSPLLQANDATTTTVYYTTTDHQWLVPLTLPIQATREVAQVAMEKLLAGPPNEFAASVIPTDTKLLDLYLTSRVVYVDVTKEFFELKPELAQKAAASIAATIAPMTQEHHIQILVEGKQGPLVGEMDFSQPFEPSYINLLNPPEDGDAEGIAVTWYFSDGQGMFLVPQTYLIPLEETQGQDLPAFLAAYVVGALLAGPDEESGLYPTIWEGTRLLSTQVEKGIVQIDLSREALGYGGGSTAEQLFLKSLIHSLASIEGIHGLQLLFEGQKLEFLPEGSDVSGPLSLQEPLNMLY